MSDATPPECDPLPPDWSITSGVSDLDAGQWDALVDPNDPFVEHAFLKALETSGSVGPQTGWRPRFVIVRRGEKLCGALPLYLKDHSYGEFIFDWAWANAAERVGLDYYPKLVSAVPFTPVTGSRFLVAGDEERDTIAPLLIQGAMALAKRENVSSIHILFCTEEESAWLAACGFSPRLSMQFHWQNRQPAPYKDFSDFVCDFRASNRKQVRKERKVAGACGVDLVTKNGGALDEADWRSLRAFYQSNSDAHGSIPYLTKAFFSDLKDNFAHRVVATFAYRDGKAVAGTLNFQKGKHIYGRYWGTTEEAPMLHFELCYYALIEKAISEGLTRFEAGAQGEHKLKRGLLPHITHSAHILFDERLNDAVSGFVRTEADMVRQNVAMYGAHSPFAQGRGPLPEQDKSE